ADVGVGLGEVSQRRAGLRIDLLGVEAHGVGVTEHGLEDLLRFAERAPARGEEFRSPEAADPERAFAPGELAHVAAEEALAARELAGDAPPGALHARAGRVAVAVPGQKEQARVHVRAAQRSRVGLELLAPAQRLDLLADEIARAREFLHRRPGQVPLLVQLDQPLQCGPAERAGMDQVAAGAALFPDSLVW